MPLRFAVAHRRKPPRLTAVNWQILQGPLFHVGGYYISFLGLVAFVAFFSAGLIVARMLQSGVVRRFFSRFKIDNNFIAIVTTILSLAALVFFIVSAINAAGIPLAWNAPLPGVTLSLFQIFLLIALLIAVFWTSSRTKRFGISNLPSRTGMVFFPPVSWVSRALETRTDNSVNVCYLE